MPKKMPIDIKKLMDSVSVIGQERDLPLQVELVCDVSASAEFLALMRQAFEAQADAEVVQYVLSSALPPMVEGADVCVVAGGNSMLLGDVVGSAELAGVPVVVCIEEGATFFTDGSTESVMQNIEAAAEIDEQGIELSEAAAGLVVGRGIPAELIVPIEMDGSEARPLEELGVWLSRRLPEKRLVLARNFAFVRHPVAMHVIINNSIQNGAIGMAVFIPGADMPLVTLNQARMILQLATVYGEELDKERAKEIIAVVAGGFGMRGIARRLVTLVPRATVAVKAGVALGGTFTMGLAAIDYFEGDGVISRVSSSAKTAVAKVSELAGNTSGPLQEAEVVYDGVE